jgi:hypothetical protein
MKRFFSFLLLTGCVLGLQGCLSFDDEEDNKTIIEHTTRDGNSFNEDDHINGYYSTIGEAIIHNNLADGKPAKYTLKQTIKLIEDEDSCIFYGTILQPENEEIFVVMRFKLRIVNNEKEFSNPLAYSPTYDFINNTLYKNKGIIKEQEMFLPINNDPYAIKKVAIYPNFIWSLTAKKDVNKLRVNNQKPTEIIPFKIENEKLYFYYFNDLKNQDEFIVTI